MLAWIQTFLTSLGDILNSVLQFFIGVVQGLFSLIKMLPEIMSVSSTAIGYLPSLFAGFAALTISICIIFLIVGRSVGDS